MMCSTWKISVFGLVALMLGFGLVTTDAAAQFNGDTLVVTATGDPTPGDIDGGVRLRAGTTLTTMVFTYTTQEAKSHADHISTVKISFPANWNFARDKTLYEASAGETVAGAVSVDATGIVADESGLEIQGKTIIVRMADTTVSGTIAVTVNGVDVPKKINDYRFGVTMQYEEEGITYLPEESATEDPAVQGVEVSPIGSRRSVYIVRVGSAPSGAGSGTLTLSGPGLVAGVDGPDDGDAIDYYLLGTDAAALGYLKYIFTAKADLQKGSEIVITLPTETAFENFNYGGGNGELTVSGPVGAPTIGADFRTATVRTNAVMVENNKIEFTYRHEKLPDIADADPITPYSFAMTSLVPLDDSDASRTAETAAAVADGPRVVTVTQGHGTGAMALAIAQNATDNKFAASGADLGNLTFTYTARGGMSIGAKVEVDIPDVWGPIFPDNGDTVNRAGEVLIDATGTATTGDLEIDGRTLRAMGTAVWTATQTVIFTVKGVKAPAEQGKYTFAARASSGTHGAPANIGGARDVEVTAPHGSGTIELRKGGVLFDQALAEQRIGNLEFIFKADGYMASKSVVNIALPDDTDDDNNFKWPSIRRENRNGIEEAGELAISGPADLNFGTATGDNRRIRFTTNAAMNAGGTVRVTYRNVTAPDAGSYAFLTTAQSFPGENLLAQLDRSPTVGVGQAPDGSGTIAFAPLAQEAGRYLATAGENLGNLTFTYSATGLMEGGAQVMITVDPDWGNTPIADDGDGIEEEGEVVLTHGAAGTLDVPGDGSITVTIEEGATLDAGDSFTITYRAITAPTTGGDYDFHISSKSTAGGTLTALSGSPITVNVEVTAAGTAVIEGSAGTLTHTPPNAEFDKLDIIFTAGVQMERQAQVRVTIPDEWTPPFRGNNAADRREGAIWVEGASVSIDPSAAEAGPWMITATTDAVVDADTDIVFAYSTVTAPSSDTVDEFTTEVSIQAGGTLLEIAESPTVTVREAVMAVTIAAMPASVFVNEDINVTVALEDAAGQPASALSATVVMLSDGGLGGSFSDADGNDVTSVTIAANDSSESATYSSSVPGMVTLTATSGEFMDTADVTVKSTIDNLLINGMEAPDPVQGGDTIIVTATGRGGADVRASVSVTQSVTDADGVETQQAVVPTKSLDEDPDATDVPEGDVAYTRDVDLGGLDDGDYTVKVTIGDDSATTLIKVLNNLDPPALSRASATPVGAETVSDGGDVALSVTVTANATIPIMSVEADVSNLDSTRTAEDTIALADADGDGTYSAIFTVSADNVHDDGPKMVSFTATGEYGPASDALTAPITLRNDFTPPELTLSTAADLGLANDGDVLMIVVNSEANLDEVWANATSVGGGRVTFTEGTVADDAEANGGGMDAGTNGANGMGSDSNGANGMDAGANGANGMDANGMTEEAMPDGDGVYTGMVTVSGAMDGEQTINIFGRDASGNVNAEALVVSVTIDNTAPMLSMANADPAAATNGTMVTISVNADESGLTITADASGIGAGMVTLMEAMMDANGMTNGNGNGANGMTNGNGANGNGASGMDANGGNGMPDSAMVYSYSATVTVSGVEEAGDHMIAISTMDAAGNEAEASASISVQIEPIVTDLMVAVDLELVKAGSTIMVSASGQPGGGTVTVMDSEGEMVGSTRALDPDGDPDMDGVQAYSRSITLPANLTDGTYTVSVDIQGETDSATVEVLNDQDPPTLSGASAWPAVVANGGQVALRVTVAMNASMVAIDSVTADVSDLDSTQTGAVTLDELASEAGTYAGFHTISADNMAADDSVMVTFTATDRIGNSNTTTASITLRNDVTPPTLSMASAMPASANDGTVITISVNGGESGLTVTADASAIGGGMVSLMEGMMAADDAANGNGNGMDANGNGANGMDANGMTNGNGNGANGMTNGMDANGMDANGGNGMMAAGNGMYTGMATVTGAEDGAQMISITATDGSGNSSSASVSVMIDNTAATLSDAAVTPDWALNGDTVTISVNGGESGLTVTADASAIGGAADEALAESADTAGMYSADVTVTGAEGGDQMVSISASDALGNMSDAVSASVSIHVVTMRELLTRRSQHRRYGHG